MAAAKDETTAEPKKRSMGAQILLDNLLIIFIVIAVFIGVGLGVGLRGVWGYEEYRKIFYLEFPGRLLLNMLKMLILPLIISSLITGMADIGSHASGKLGAAAIFYYMTTTLAAVITGIILVLTIHPGNASDRNNIRREGASLEADPLDSLLDLISQCFPENLVSACFERVITKFKIGKSDPRINETHYKLYNLTETDNSSFATYTVDLTKPYMASDSGMNVLGIVVFSIALGCVINHLGEQGKPLKDFFSSLNAATMVLINIVIWYTPIGIIFLIASKFILTKDIGGVLSDMGMYMATVLGGLAIHGIVTLPVLYVIFTRKNPVRFAANMAKALCTAWGTASSSATLPITMDCLVNKNKININVVRFVAPVGATINMDGTALYEAVACIFIAQVNNLDLSVADVIIVSLTATAAAVGAAGVPQAGLVTLVIVLTAVGLPSEDVTLILSIDWLLDRFRTAINVWGDCIGSGILDHFFKDTFERNANTNHDDTISNIVSSGSSSISKKDDLSEDSPPSYSGLGHENEAFEADNTQTKL
ncbi:excitatory amino acid transporter 3-like [Physella acuta]|uniref:excitatory amino acid transporter 3-like n=1 Tax=Physella acuta TaxID=109671 RepID=UPI0027DE49C3|nr:excitatory amino acid transporter 3-like [Physella acuta]